MGFLGMSSYVIDHWEAISPAVFHTTPSKGISFKCQSMAFFMVREAQQRSGWECGQGDLVPMPIQVDMPFFPLFNCQAVGVGKYAKMIKHC